MYKSLKFGLSAIALALLAACGGGGSDSSSSASGYTVSGGTVQKGPLVQGSSITVNTLNSTTWQPNGDSYTFEITNNLGKFSAASTVFSAQYAESTALGYYFNELTGAVSDDMVFLRGLSDLKNDKSINLNVLTDMVRARIRVLTTRTISKLTFANARLQAQKELLAAFQIYNSAGLFPGGATQPANFNELDLSKTRDADQILAAISGVITQMGQNGSGISLALSKLEVDLADDGQINNSPNYAASTVTGLRAAAAATNFTAVANNLNAFYGNANFTGASVGQWIDSSGGVDGVIDKNKFTAAGTLNVESVSPVYAAGSNDVGQCFSVTAGNLYRQAAGAGSASLVSTATVKAVKGDRFQIGLTPATTDPLSGFIQRSAPVAGVCPTVLPTAGLTRVVKYSVTATGFAPQRMLVFGDEASLLTRGSSATARDGKKYTINGFTPDTTPAFSTLDCGINLLWVQWLAANYNFVFEACNFTGAPVTAFNYSTAGARVADAVGQVNAWLSQGNSFVPTDLVTVMVGQNDIIELYEAYLLGPQTLDAQNAAVTAAFNRGKTLAALFTNVITNSSNSKARALYVVIPDVGKTPYGLSQSDGGALLSRMTFGVGNNYEGFNLGLRNNIGYNGRSLGLVDGYNLFFNLTNNTENFANNNGIFNLTDAGCLPANQPAYNPAKPDDECNSLTLVDPGVAYNDNYYMWADQIHFGVQAHFLLGDRARFLVENNPF